MGKKKPSGNAKAVAAPAAAPADNTVAQIFAFFNEVGIISQLSGAILARSLPNGVHPSHFAIINHLSRLGDARSPLRIASAMQVTKTTMTHSLKVLEGKGFITIKPNPEDARSKLVYLTAEGRQFRETAIQQTVETYGNLLNDEQRNRMAALLPELTEVRRFLDDNRLQ